ncbi:MAG: hypothetical protein AAB038_05385, partial [Planctomycetota bacterium]
TTPDKLSKFKRILDSRMVHWGSEIITQGYDVRVINKANEELNRLVNDYRRPEIAPFASGGDSSRLGRDGVYPALGGAVASSRNNRDFVATSHIDFVVVEIPDSARPGMRIKQLGLEIQVVGG